MRQPSIVYSLASQTDNINVSSIRDDSQVCSAIDSLAITGANESTGVTDFVQEACESVDVLSSSSATYTLMAKDAKIQHLTDYFSRPVCISSGVLPTATRTRVFVADFDELYSFFPNGAARLTGVYGMRASMVFTLQVAATPFHQGVLAMSFQYACSSVDNDKYIRSSNSASCTSLPHARLDLSTGTMLQFRVPFLATEEYTIVGTGFGSTNDYGSFALNTILPIPTIAGASAPSHQIFYHLEDIEFFGATPLATTVVTLQSGKRVSPITEEFEKESHPFSSATMALSRSVKWISKGVPMISSIGGPTSWFLEKAAGAIRSFGYARPQIVDPVMRTFRQDNIGEQNVDVASPCQVVGAFASNTLRVSPMFGGTDVDEMSLKYITSQWSQIQSFPIASTDAAGTVLYATPISPASFWFRTGGSAPFCNIPPRDIAPTSTNSFLPSNLFFFGQMFKSWRGGIKFRFTFSKTKLHGGRIMIAYNPYCRNLNLLNGVGILGAVAVPSYTTTTAGVDPFGVSAIYDLRDGNVFEFTVPYVNNNPFVAFTSHVGALAMYVVNPLQVSSVVSSTINCMVEVCGDTDFEFANPRTPIWPIQPNPTLTFQSGKVLGGAVDDLCEHTMGECLTSVKQLIGIPKVTAITTTAGTKYNLIIPPWFYQPTPSVLTPAPTAHLTESFGYGGNIASCYTFVKGSTDFHAYMNQSNTAGRQWLTIAQIPDTASAQTIQGPQQPPFSNAPRIVNSSGGAIHADRKSVV